MGLQFHPLAGSILICDFNTGFVAPEMVKRRPVIVISPQIVGRHGLCSVVPMSTQIPNKPMPYHCELTDINPALPAPWDKGPNWVKGDMVTAVSLKRLDLIRVGKDANGDRVYRYDLLSADQMKRVKSCVLHALGMGALTNHLS
jgi:uncharacterized protein YifN (PemK superfamily)